MTSILPPVSSASVATEFMTGVSGAETERSGPKLGWSGAERVSEKLGGAERSVSVGAAERERSGERRSKKSGLMRSGKTFRSAHMLCTSYWLVKFKFKFNLTFNLTSTEVADTT